DCLPRSFLPQSPPMLESTPIATDLLEAVGKRAFGTILADPPWRFVNRTGKMAPEHRRLSRYGTLTTAAIMALPVAKLAASASHPLDAVPGAGGLCWAIRPPTHTSRPGPRTATIPRPGGDSLISSRRTLTSCRRCLPRNRHRAAHGSCASSVLACRGATARALPVRHRRRPCA